MNINEIFNDIMASLQSHINDRPKQIFMSYKLCEYLSNQYVFDVRLNKDGRRAIYGVPVKCFDSGEYEWWLSWEGYKYE